MNNAISRNRKRKRKLVCESLESRQLIASDLIYHNFIMPEDSDMSGDVTPLEALMVINQLNAGSSTGASDIAAAFDVDADGTLSPLDALTSGLQKQSTSNCRSKRYSLSLVRL